MSAYVIFDVEIRDLERYQTFMQGVKPALDAAGARYLARGGAHQVHEGDWLPRRIVILEFPIGRGLGGLLQRPDLPGPEVDPRRVQLGAAGVGGRPGMKPLRLTVLGSGSVGLAFAASYAKAGQQVTLLARGAAMAELRQQGIAVSGVCGEHRIEPGMLKVSDAEQPAAEDVACDVLVVATKAYQVGPVLRRLAQQAGTSLAPKAVLLLQNGWGSADEARAALPAGLPLFSSIMMIGIERRSPVHVNVNVQASPVRVGSLFAAPPEGVLDAVARGQAGFLPITFEAAIERAILDKFLFNTCLNAISAITRMSYGQLVGNSHTRGSSSRRWPTKRCASSVPNDGVALAHGRRQLRRPKRLTPFVLPKAAAHRSSMLQDVEAGRRTEIDYLNGAVVRMGRAHDLPTHCNGVVASLVRSQESVHTASHPIPA
jgi:2-dehydropantoate 2-reductase